MNYAFQIPWAKDLAGSDLDILYGAPSCWQVRHILTRPDPINKHPVKAASEDISMLWKRGVGAELEGVTKKNVIASEYNRESQCPHYQRLKEGYAKDCQCHGRTQPLRYFASCPFALCATEV